MQLEKLKGDSSRDQPIISLSSKLNIFVQLLKYSYVM